MPSEGDLRGLAEGVHLSGEIYWGGHMTPYSRARCPQNCRGGCDMHGICFPMDLIPIILAFRNADVAIREQ